MKTFFYPITIKEIYLDLFGHMNNADYFVLFEEARWEFLAKNNYGVDKILQSGFGPTILGAEIKFQKELKVRDEIIIESEMLFYKSKIGKLSQKMIRSGEECCTAEFTIGLFNIKERKLMLPTPEWRKAIGMEENIK